MGDRQITILRVRVINLIVLLMMKNIVWLLLFSIHLLHVIIIQQLKSKKIVNIFVLWMMASNVAMRGKKLFLTKSNLRLIGIMILRAWSRFLDKVHVITVKFVLF